MLVSTDTISTTESAFFTYWFSRRPVMLGIFAQTVERTAPPKKGGKRGKRGKGGKGEKRGKGTAIVSYSKQWPKWPSMLGTP